MTNPYTIEAIPTEYKGLTYRSRLEAQHAVFFDLLGVDFFYECEVFDFVDYEGYLPDFRVFMPGLTAPRWIEVKGPELYEMADIKAKLLAAYTAELVQVWQGSWGSQIIYSYVDLGGGARKIQIEDGREIHIPSEVVRISSKNLDSGFSYWPMETIKQAYNEALDYG